MLACLSNFLMLLHHVSARLTPERAGGTGRPRTGRGPPPTADIPVDLRPPAVTFTPRQQFYAGAYLTGLADIETREGCRVDLRWEDGGETGSRKLGP